MPPPLAAAPLLAADDRKADAHAAPLRLGQAGSDAVIEAHPIRCSSFDAYRFFTPAAVDRNRSRPTYESRPALEQPGCPHAGMDPSTESACD